MHDPANLGIVWIVGAGHTWSVSLAELRSLITANADRDLPFGGMFLTVVTQATAPTPMLTGPVLALVAQGAKRAVLGERVYDYRAGQYLVVSVDLPVTGNFTEASPDEPFLGVGLMLEPAAVAALLLETDNRITRGVAHPGIAVSDAGAELVDAVVRLLRLFDRPADVPVLAPMIKREILWRLVTGPQSRWCVRSGLPTAASVRHWPGDPLDPSSTTRKRCGSTSWRS